MVSRMNSNEKARSRSVIRACGAILTLAVGVLANWTVTQAQNAIIYPLGPEVPLGQMSEGPGKVSIPPNAVLSSLQLGKGQKDGPRWLNLGYRNIQGGVRQLELGEESMLPTTIAPASNGGSAPIHAPEGTIVSALQLGSGSLSVWYRKVTSPANFKLGPEEAGPRTKEPHDNGGGNVVSKDRYTITGFQWQKDRDGTLALNIWYRPVL
jgi:hypothetical protein